MDKSWMKEDRRSDIYVSGVNKFLDFAYRNAVDKDRIRCPCIKCCNGKQFTKDVIKDHITFNGFNQNYTHWSVHGESKAMKRKPSTSETTVNWDPLGDMGENGDDEISEEDAGFLLNFLEDADRPLYAGCTRTTKMCALLESLNLKAKFGMSDANYSAMLKMYKGWLPEDNEVPASFYEAKKTLLAMGMDHQKFHACPNDCIVYRKEHAEATICPRCGLSRWKISRAKVEKVGVPAKVVWYFPPFSRFKRMFADPKIAKDLTWHADSRKKDGIMRHPADSPTWKVMDTGFPVFGVEPRNLRLGLSTDGFNPFRSLSSKYSCWPVMLVTYNLPPSLCMKRKFMMLTMLISGPKQPGNDIDVYYQILVDDLQTVWKGIHGVYDAFRNEYFTLRACLLWTINDFPAYGNVSGSYVKGYNGCPVCVDKTKPFYLKHSKKMSYMRHRRWLPKNHAFRRQAAKFDNTIEEDDAHLPLTGEEVLARVEGLGQPLGKTCPPPMHKEGQIRPCWKKKSVFFELEYWKLLPVRHNLDVMHIEKNVCEALLGTLLNIPTKTKDGLATRNDLVEMGIRTDLKPTEGAKRKPFPLASWNLNLEEKRIVCGSFFGMSVPTRFSSNIRNLVSLDDLRLVGLKSHDCHVILQLLLPVALRNVLEKPVRQAIIRFCLFFKAICAKEIDTSKLKDMQRDLVITVCMLEKYFPPSFFDIMIHLTVHLVREVELCGPVFFRWMYPFERYMKTLKGYVKNGNRPEGCIAEKYIVEEAVEYNNLRVLENQSTVGLPAKKEKNDGGRGLCGEHVIDIFGKEKHLAHLCVLQNSTEVLPFFSEHMELMQLMHPRFKKRTKWLKDKQNETFAAWLKQRIGNELRYPDNEISQTVRWLANGPSPGVYKYEAYHINEVDYNTEKRDGSLTCVQNSGVLLFASAMQVSSARDNRPVTDDMNFYGVIQEIWELDYYTFRVPLFKCNWVENSRGVKVDELGYTLVNLNRKGHLNDPFVLATHVKQIFYLQATLNGVWSVVVKCPNQDYRGPDFEDQMEDTEVEAETAGPLFDDIDETEDAGFLRDGDEGIWVEE